MPCSREWQRYRAPSCAAAYEQPVSCRYPLSASLDIFVAGRPASPRQRQANRRKGVSHGEAQVSAAHLQARRTPSGRVFLTRSTPVIVNPNHATLMRHSTLLTAACAPTWQPSSAYRGSQLTISIAARELSGQMIVDRAPGSAEHATSSVRNLRTKLSLAIVR